VPVDARLLVDLVAGGFRAQPGDRAVKLELLELCLLQVAVELAELAVRDRELAVVLLVDGVAAAEEAELELLVLGTRVDLGRHLAQLHLEFAERVPGPLEPVAEPRPPDPGHVRRVLGVLLLGPEVKDRLLGVLHPLVEPAAVGLARLEAGLLAVEGAPAFLGLGAQARERDLEGCDRFREPAVLQGAPGEAQVAQTVAEPLVAHRLRRLALQAPDLPADLADHVGDAGQVLVRQRELAHGLPRWLLYLVIPAASSNTARRSSGLEESTWSMWPWAMIE
jgi:hypothetical protein